MMRGQTDGFGWHCLVGRRLAERGVRFVELVDGSSSQNWNQHGDMAEHAKHARSIDEPIGGLTDDATDDIGAAVVENRVQVHNLHATLLHLLGVDHERLTLRHGGRDYHLTDVHSHVVQAFLA